MPPREKALGMTGGTEATGAAGKHQESRLPTVRAADPGETAAGVAAVAITLPDFLYDRPKETVLLLEPDLILGVDVQPREWSKVFNLSTFHNTSV